MSALVLWLLCASPDAGVSLDPMRQALAAEVARATTLTMPAMVGAKATDRPYLVSAFLNESETFDAWASFGALGSRSHPTTRTLSARVRVGSPKFDNTNFQDQSFSFGGEAKRHPMPGEPDPDLVRYTTWLLLDDAYKAGLETLAKKRAFLETNAVSEALDDFGSAPRYVYDRPRVPLAVDAEKSVGLVRRVSAIFLDNPLLQEGTAWYRGASNEQDFVSSEGSTHRFGEREVRMQLAVTAQASDGMELRLSKRFTGEVDADLPSEAQLVEAAKALSGRMTQLAKAPVADEDYAGPVLFVDQAAAVFFLSTLGEPLTSPRDQLGTRQNGRMTDRLGKRVAARFLSAWDDPTMERWGSGAQSAALWGAFPVDDEGVQARRVNLVEEGVLKNYYMSRTPTAKVRQSNGHCRGEQAGIGTLVVQTSAPQPRAALKKRLLELAKDEDLDYGLLVELSEERMGHSGDPRLTTPVLVWKVYVDGREELVRGLTFKPPGARILKEIEAMGDDPAVLNLEHQGQRTSVVAPSVLVRLLELTRTRQDFEKPPVLPRP